MQVVYTEADLYCKKRTAKQAAGGKGEAPKEDEATLLDLLQVVERALRLKHLQVEYLTGKSQSQLYLLCLHRYTNARIYCR